MRRYPGIGLGGNQVVINVPVPAQTTMVSIAPVMPNYQAQGSGVYSGGMIPMAVPNAGAK